MAVGMIGGPRLCEPLPATGLGRFTGGAREQPESLRHCRLALQALHMALARRCPQPGTLVHHSDRGVQYASGDYTRTPEAHGLLASMSRVGNPYDNAKAESFMKTLKTEEVDGADYCDLHHARRCIGAFIEQVYNCRRRHSALAFLSPAGFEVDFRAHAASAAAVPAMGFSRNEKIFSDTA